MYKLTAKNLSSISPNILISFHSGCISMDFSFTFQTVPIQCFILKAIQLNCWLQKELQGSKVLHYRSSSSMFWDFQSSHTYLSFLLHAQDSGMPNFTVKPANPSPHTAAEEERERISRHGLKSIPPLEYGCVIWVFWWIFLLLVISSGTFIVRPTALSCVRGKVILDKALPWMLCTNGKSFIPWEIYIICY